VYEWELVPRFYSKPGTLRQEINRYKDHPHYGIKKLQKGGNGRAMLIAFDSLKTEIRTAIGDPRKTDNALERFYRVDSEAALFYSGFKFQEDGSTLTAPQQDQYTINASVIKAAIALKFERQIARNSSRKLMDSILADVTAFNKILENKYGVKHSLPTSLKRFKMLFEDFQKPFNQYEFNYATIISGKLRNQNSAKIRKEEVSQDIMQSLLEHPNQYDDVYIQIAYNKQAKLHNLKPITPATVGIWRRKLDHLIKPMREGWDEWRQTHNRRIHRARPSQPCYLWESDDNHLDLLFNGDDNNPYHRYKSIFVTDSHSDLVLGYACCEGELTPAIVRLAYLQAMYYVRSLTGGWYLPHEVKTDRWRLSALRPFYSKMANYYDSPVNSKNRGWLENFFGCEDWKRCLKTDTDGTPAVNYTGNNIKAKNAGFNREMSRVNTKLFPHITQAPAQIEAFVHRLRNIDLNGTGSREQRWLEAWTNLPDEEKRPITDEQFLLLFGLSHDFTNSIEKSGITATIMGHKISYAVPPALYLPNVGKKVQVLYDPFDLSRVLVTDNQRLRFVARQVTMMPGTMRDMQLMGEGSRAFLNQVLNEKRADVDYIINERDKRQKRLETAGIDVDYVLQQGGYVAKEIAQTAEAVYLGSGGSYDEFDPADQM